jgi:adenylate cyclase
MRAISQKRIGALIIWGVVSLLAALSIDGDIIRDVESRTWDWRLCAIATQRPHSSSIKIITIDQASLDYFARYETIYWPWPRSLYVPVLEFIKKAGARAAAFDLLFTEGAGRVDDDREFASAVKRGLPVVNALVLREKASREGTAGVAEFVARQSQERSTLDQYVRGFTVRSYSDVVLPIPELVTASAALGNVAADPDHDQIFRSTIPGAYLHDVPVLNLPFALFSLVRPDNAEIHKLRDKADARGKLLVRFFGSAGTYETFSMHAVIASWLEMQEGRAPSIPLSTFKDSYVFIGATAPGLLDLRSVPVGGAYSGVEINATIFDNLLQQSFLRQPSIGWVVVAIAALLACACFATIVWSRYQVVISLVVLGGWIAACIVGAFLGWWLPMVVPVCAIVCAVSAGFFVQYRIEGKQHRFIRGAFQHYVTAEVVEKITADPSLLSLGGDRKELTMLFSDIAGFTTLSESMSPAKLVRFINTFLSEMTDIVFSVQGTIDKYEGDAIIAFWNAPVSIEDHAARAVRAALLCQHRLRELQEYFKAEFGVDVKMRVGINTGVVTVGNFGSKKRFNYTMIGDAANLASRLEGTNKVFGTRILVSEATKRQAGDAFMWRRVADVQVKGKKQTTRLYEPLDTTTQTHIIARLDTFDAALRAFECGERAAAVELFGQIPDDPVSGAYLARIRDEHGRAELKPVWVLLEK